MGNTHDHGGSQAACRLDVDPTVHLQDALPHAGDSESGPSCLVHQSHAVVGDLEDQRAVLPGQRYLQGRRPGVFHRVVDGFLGDPEQRQLGIRREAIFLVQVVHC